MEKKLKSFTVRLSVEDSLKLISQADNLKISQAELIRKLIRQDTADNLKKYIESLDDLRKIARSLSNNINQITKKINSKILINELEEAQKIHGEITEIWQLLKL